jgi:diguanylate cyclase (GGDEF)-like protein/PAS domain S-box-containing protein
MNVTVQTPMPEVATGASPIAVLLVEDDPGDAGLVRHALRAFPGRFTLTHCTSLAGAVASIAGRSFDVILLDLSLPDSMGFDTIRRMRQIAPAAALVVLTGYDDEDFAIEAMAAGTQDYLVKGETNQEALQRAIRYAIARKHLEERVRQSEERLHRIIALAQDAIVVADGELHITLFNPAAERMFGYRADDVLGMPLDRVLPERHRMVPATSTDGGESPGGEPQESIGRFEAMGVTRDGREFPVEVSVSRDVGREGSLLTAVVRDIAARKLMEKELRLLAATDPLTGLSNRRQFLAAADRELARLHRYGRPVAAMMVDIDHFKVVNDTYGHAAGDRALQQVAVACCDILRDSDVIGRLGGEEFGIVLPEASLEGALDVAERLRIRLAAEEIPLPEDPAGGTFRLTVSIGVAPCIPTDRAIDMPLNRADRALYRAKERGRNRVEVEVPSGTPLAAVR